MEFSEIISKLNTILPSKKEVDIGDIMFLLLSQNGMAWAVVTRVENKGTDLKEIDIKLLSLPPMPLTITVTSKQLAGEESISINNDEAHIRVLDLEHNIQGEEIYAVSNLEERLKNSQIMYNKSGNKM